MATRRTPRTVKPVTAKRPAATPADIVRWQALLDFAGEALALLDADARVLRATGAMDRLWPDGTRVEGRQLAELFVEQDADAVAAALERCLGGEPDTSFTARPKAASEELRWVEVTLSNRLEDPAAGAILARARDLTEQREMEERYAALFSVAPVGIAQLGMDRRIQYVNDQLCEIFCHSREDLVGRRLKDFSHPDDNQATESAVAELIDSRATASSIEKRFMRGDGRVVWTRMTMANPRDERFALHRVVVLEDITARKEAEERLNQLSQLHIASGEINEAILRTGEPGALLEDACEVIVKHCGFEIATVRLANEARGTLELAATAGPLVDWMQQQLAAMPVDRLDGAGLGPEAFRSGRPCVSNDYTYDARFFGRDTPEQRAGLRSAAAFPLKRSARSSGVILVGSREREMFDDGLVGLLEHIAENISYALEKIEQSTEQAHAEQALRESEARFRGLVELATDVYWEQDTHYRFVRVADSSFTSVLTLESVLGKCRWDIAEAQPLEGTWAEHIAVLDARLPFRNFEYRHRLTDGSIGFISANGEPAFDAGGRFTGYRGTARDITNAKRDEAALRRFRAALDQSSELVLLVEGGTGRIIDFNESVCDTLGYRRSELMGQPLSVLVAGRTEEEVRARNRALLETPERRDQIRRTYRRKDGSTLEVEVVRQAMILPDGDIVVAIGRDLTHRIAAERRMFESEERFRQLVENIPQVFWIVDARSRRLLYISPDHARLLGRTLPEHPTAEDWARTVHPEDAERIRIALQRIGDSPYDEHYRVLWPDGTVRWMHSRAFPIRNESGEMVRIAGIAEDVTEARLAERRMRQQARHEECISRFGRQALAEKDIDALMQAAAFAVQSGLGVDQVLLVDLQGTRLRVRASLGAPVAAGALSQAEPQLASALQALEGGVSLLSNKEEPAPRLLPDGWLSASASVVACPITPAQDSRGTRLLIAAASAEASAFSAEEARFVEAISSLVSTALHRHESETRLAYLAQFDSLTGLANRSLLRDRLAQAIAQAKRHRWTVAVLFVDLDRFKLVNDTLGHSSGDHLLAEAGRRLTQCVRGGDTVGRISGDEFAIVLADLARADDAAIVSRKVLETLAGSFQLGEHETFVSASIGIAVFPADANEADTLLKNADTAMYRAKEAGRNGYCFFTSEMNRRSQHRLHLAGELRHAIERREFRLHYQPKVDLARGQVCGMEALLRWQHPERGLVAPDEFIPVLEETGLIMIVGEWVLREACRQLHEWRSQGLALVPVAVNVSPRQFRDKELDSVIHECASAHGIGTELIELEITETHLMENPSAARRVLGTLQQAGVRISVDDFGTGYSSLSYLTEFPLSSLKIDRSFVRNLDTDGNAASIVRAIVNMAKSLRFITIAEGVEEESQAAFLRELGCDQAQGFLYAAPLPAAEMADRLRR